MRAFIKNIILFTLVCFGPFILLLIAGYFYYDPFKVLNKYCNEDYNYANLPVIPKNRDYMSTELFLKNYPAYHYNSFIFGSSRSLSARPSAWKKYLNPADHPFSFDATGESLYGIYRKIKFLDERKIEIKNAIIFLCRDWSFLHDSNPDVFLFTKHPAISGESSFNFQSRFFMIYFDKRFLKAFYTYKFTHQYYNWMQGIIINDNKMFYDTVTNELHNITIDSIINADQAGYYSKRKDIFYPRTGETLDSVNRINGKYIFMLSEIKRILEKNKSNYKVVCSPLYDEVKFSPHDKQLLKQFFGPCLYDFTGKNELTEKVSNYYEVNHFRPFVGDSIFSAVYR